MPRVGAELPGAAWPIADGPLILRPARDGADLAAARALRARCFRPGQPDGPLREADGHDRRCLHLLAIDRRSGGLAGCCRMARFTAAELGDSYAARHYGLGPLAAAAPGPMLELGRLCIDRSRPADLPGARVLRLMLAALTGVVEATGAQLLFGCSSFPGSDWRRHAPALAYLRDRHPGPAGLVPQGRAAGRVPLAAAGPLRDPAAAEAALPPLLRAYLGLGGWVGDHAVPDPDLDTLHVFTAVEVARIPARRAQALRALWRLAAAAGAEKPDPLPAGAA